MKHVAVPRRWAGVAAATAVVHRMARCERDRGEPVKLNYTRLAGVAVGRDGLYVADKTAGKGRVCKLDLDTKNPRQLVAMPKKQCSLFGLAVDKQDNCFVVDNGLRKLWKICPHSTEPIELAPIQDYGKNPLGAVCDSNGNVFVAEMYSGSIIKVNSSGESEIFASSKLDGPSRHGGPVGIACDAHDRIFVSFCQTNEQFYMPCGKVLRYDKSGRECTEIWSSEERAPKGIAVDTTGVIVVLDALHNELICIAPTGEVLCSLPTETKKEVSDIAIGKNGVVYITSGDGILLFDVRAAMRGKFEATVAAKKRTKAELKVDRGADSKPLLQKLDELRSVEKLLRAGTEMC
jgi:sugar lactone lactonase YvrE